MLSISDPITSAAGAVDYYTNKALEAYYTEGKVGRWFGGAADLLQLPESVNPETLHSLLMGFSPDGNRALVKNAGAPDRTCGWDLTFSAPKPVSRLWATLPEPERSGIEADHRGAVETTLKIAEEMFGISRSGQGGKVHERAKLIFAVFDEYTSRANDMQIHSHCVLVNTGVKGKGKTGALHSINFFRAKMLLGTIYQVSLAANLRRRHSLAIKPERVAFGIEGVPKHLCRIDSKRRIDVEKAMAERGLVSAEAAKVAALETRPAKKHIPLVKLFPHWQETGRQHGFGPGEALKLIQARTQTHTSEQSLDRQINDAIEQMPKAEQTKRNLLRAARQIAMECSAGGDKLMEVLTQLRLPDGEPLVWTPFQKSKAVPQSNRPEQAETIKPAQAIEFKIEAAEISSEPPASANQFPSKTTSSPVPSREQPHQTKAEGMAKKAAKEEAKKSEKHEAETSNPLPKKNAKKERASNRQESSNTESHAKESAKKSAKADRLQRRMNLKFERQFGAAVDRIFPEKQTRTRLTKLAYSFAAKYGADYDTLVRTLDTMRPGAERSFVHVETPRPFPKSPIAPLKWLRVPKVALGDKPRKWGDIVWKKKLPIGELRLQNRRLCPSAPKWSPLYGIEITSLRFGPQKKNNKSSRASLDAAKQAEAKKKSKTKENSQSQ